MLKVDTLAELVQAAKAQPGKLNWAATPGLPVYVLLALAAARRHRDGATSPTATSRRPTRISTRAGCMSSAPACRRRCAHHRAGTAKLLFVTNRERSPQVPDVPTAKEAGYPDLTFEGVVRRLRLARHAGRDPPERVVADVAPIVADPGISRPRAQGRHGAAQRHAGSEFAAAIEAQREQIAAIHAASAKPRPSEALSFAGRCLASRP